MNFFDFLEGRFFCVSEGQPPSSHNLFSNTV